MNWHVTAGVAQLALIALFLATQGRARRCTGEVLLYAVPMTGLAVGTLVGAGWVVVVAAVFYSVWLVNHVLSWSARPASARIRPTGHDGPPDRIQAATARIRPTGHDGPPDRIQAATPAPVRAAVGVVSLAVLGLTWGAVVAAAVRPVV
jgi:hypothetical protein